MDSGSSRFWAGFWTLVIGHLIAYVLWFSAGDQEDQPAPTPTGVVTTK